MSFRSQGRASFGLLEEGGIVDAGRRLEGRFGNLRDVLLAEALDELGGLTGSTPDYPVDEVDFLPVVADPAAKFLCIGVNYMPHIREMGRDPPDYPVVFVRFASSLVGHGQGLVKPAVSEQYDFEGELAVVIGKHARGVTRDRALEHVAGYACFMDGSVRDYQRHGLQWTPGKNFPASGSFGPWLVRADDCAPPTELHLRTRLNGAIVQDEQVAQLCFDVPQLIEYCSTWVELLPGDVLVTGTPGGVGAGRSPPLWLKIGDTVEVDIEGVGCLRNTVVDEDGA